jgi:hypothetical protein
MWGTSAVWILPKDTTKGAPLAIAERRCKSGYLLPEALSGAQCCEECRKCSLSVRPADALWFTDYHSSVWQSFSF